MMPMTPSGTRTRAILRPLGRAHSAIDRPTGSGSAAIASRPAAIASMRPSSSRRRSIIAAFRPRWRPPSRSLALASSMVATSARRAAAAAASAAFLVSVDARDRRAAASLAWRPIRSISAAMTSPPSLSVASCPRSGTCSGIAISCLRQRTRAGSAPRSHPTRPGRRDGSSHRDHGIPARPLYHGFCDP